MNKWKSSFAISLVINSLLFSGMAIAFMMTANSKAEPEVMSIEFISGAELASAGASSPAISTPAPKHIDIPTPPTQEVLEQIKEGIPVEEIVKADLEKKYQPEQSSATASSSMNSNGSQLGGHGEGGSDGQGAGRVVGVSHGPSLVSEGSVSLPKSVLNGKVGSYSVGLSMRIEADGSVSSVSVTNSSGISAVDEAAQQGGYDYIFRPAMRDGQPVPSRAIQTITVSVA